MFVCADVRACVSVCVFRTGMPYIMGTKLPQKDGNADNFDLVRKCFGSHEENSL